MGIFDCFGENVRLEPMKYMAFGPASASCSLSSQFGLFHCEGLVPWVASVLLDWKKKFSGRLQLFSWASLNPDTYIAHLTYVHSPPHICSPPELVTDTIPAYLLAQNCKALGFGKEKLLSSSPYLPLKLVFHFHHVLRYQCSWYCQPGQNSLEAVGTGLFPSK